MAQVDVIINDRSYRIACDDGQDGHVTELARYLDGRVQELVSSVGQVGDARLLVMASLLIADELSETLAGSPRQSSGLVRGPPTPWSIRAAGGRGTVDVGPASERAEFRANFGRVHVGTKVPFWPEVLAASWGNYLAIGIDSTYVVTVYSADGREAAQITRDVTPPRPTASDWEMWVSRQVGEDTGTWRAAHEQVLDAAPRPDHLPAFADIRFDTDGLLWVRDYPRPSDTAQTWHVYDRAGSWLGPVALPTTVRQLVQITRTHVLDVVWDQYDAPVLRIHRLDRSVSPGRGLTRVRS